MRLAEVYGFVSVVGEETSKGGNAIGDAGIHGFGRVGAHVRLVWHHPTP